MGIAITRSTPSQNGSPPRPGRDQTAPMSAPARTFTVIQTATPAHDPHPEALEPPADREDRAGERERRAHDGDHDDPDERRIDAEQIDRDGVRDPPHRPELEGRPSDQLHEVRDRRHVGPAEPEHGTEEHHRGHPVAGAGRRDEPERDASDRGPDHDRERPPSATRAPERAAPRSPGRGVRSTGRPRVPPGRAPRSAGATRGRVGCPSSVSRARGRPRAVSVTDAFGAAGVMSSLRRS